MSALAVQGASSSAGKSLLTTALARALRRRGIDVVPFKAQNMSNNARVVDGGEIGAAQYLQALAADVEPTVRMNPVLVKPEAGNRSQVVVLGRPDAELSRMAWRSRRERLWQVVESSLRDLLDKHELVLIEGAGSPAEINLRDTDLANMRTAKLAGAQVLLVADIDRGGAFAHLYGTFALLPEDERSRIAGFVLNKFRGDRSLLPPGPEQLEELTGVPTLGVLPWLDHGLPDEDGAAMPGRVEGGASVAVIRYPTASNLDEFKALEQVADVRWAGAAGEIDGADLVVLPGSKHVAADLAWLARSGVAAAVRDRVDAGLPVLAICGGMQMLGKRIEDGAGVDGSAQGLGLLPIATTFARAKRADRVATRFGPLAEPWAALSGKAFTGYEIRHGCSEPTAPIAEALPDGLGFAKGSVLGVYPHGLFECPELLTALFGAAPARSLERAFEGLADAVEEHIDLAALLRRGGIG
ncbi:MAG TPA: cobyric acid synthase [Solirubrobacterales bacterium]|nr:cobyric acid synthase [Solirubrobacterales bacterium]